ncbi:MAG TPA: protein kinase [Candidatus Hydrogenedentes bacterium]|nr:protein kinase [Candidatus Hydrogenedentota bacterium]HPG69311.1 protein kinase [Candidatus Hydrogenedentota bacterium]
MDRDRNLLLGVFAVQLRQVTPSQLAAAAVDWASDRERDLGRRLVDSGALTPQAAELLVAFVDQTVAMYGGDASAALEAFGGERQVTKSFRSSIELSESGDVEPIPEAALILKDAESVPAVEESEGRYADLAEYGRGGMGRIVLVHDTFLGREIALKELLSPGDKKGSSGRSSSRRQSVPHMARFLEEARITGQLEHPSIVPVYEIGHRKDGTLYYTMKLVRGTTLDQAIKGAASLEERLGLLPHFVDVCQAIAYAHSRGIIHRDIKPGNVMVGEFGETVVLDWGLAKNKAAQDVHEQGFRDSLEAAHKGSEMEVHKTVYGRAVGTPAYMPPEQAEGRLNEVDEQSDVYSLGGLLYELLTGRPPFEGENVYTIIWRVMSEEPESITSREPKAPPELCAICRRAMHKDKAARYASAKALADEVQRFLSGALVQTYEYRTFELIRRFFRRYKAIFATAAIAAVALVLTGVVSYVRVVEERDAALAAREKEQQAREAEERARRESELAREEEHEARQLAERESYRSSVLLAQRNIEDGLFERARKALWATPEDKRNWEWGYLLGRCYQDVYTFSEHDDRIVDLDLSPDGSRFATASWDGAACVWEMDTGRLAAKLKGHEDGLTCVAFSPDGTAVATASFDATARVWDTASGALRMTLTGHEGAVNAVAFSPDGTYLATASQDETARVWDLASGEPIKVFGEEGHSVSNVSFGPSGNRVLIVAQGADARIVDLETGVKRMTFGGEAWPCSDAFFSPDGTRVLTTFLGKAGATAVVWDVTSGEAFATLAGHADRVVWAGFSADARDVATASSDNTARVWDTESGVLLAEFRGHTKTVNAAAFSPDGRQLATVSKDQTVRLWDIVSEAPLAVFAGHEGSVVDVRFTRDGKRLLTTSEDGTAKLWEVPADEQEDLLCEADAPVADASFSRDGTRLAMAFTDDTVAVWDTEARNELLALTCFSEQSRAAVSPDGRLLATAFAEAGFSCLVWIWDIDQQCIVNTLSGSLAQVEQLTFSPSGECLATASSDGVVRVWRTDSGALERTFEGHAKNAPCVCYDSGGTRIATSYADDTARVWDLEKGCDVATFHVDQWLDRLSFTPDGEGLMVATEEYGLIWGISTNEPLAALDGAVERLSRAPFSPSGARVVGISSGSAKVWKTDTGEDLLTVPGVELAEFHPDGRRLLLVQTDKAVRFLSAEPFRPDMLPGDDSIEWVDRYAMHKQTRLAQQKTATPATQKPSVLAMVTREGLTTRLNQFVRICALEVHDAKTTEQAAGYVVRPDAAAPILARLGAREGDRIVVINGAEIRDRNDIIEAFQKYLNAPNDEASATFALSIVRGSRRIHLRYLFVDRVHAQIDVSIPRVALMPLIKSQLDAAKAKHDAFLDHDLRLARWHLEPVFGNEPAGFWIGEAYNPYADNFLRRLGLQPGDRVLSVNDRTITSSVDLLDAVEAVASDLAGSEVDHCVIEIQRGQFQRFTIDLAFTDPQHAEQP